MSMTNAMVLSMPPYPWQQNVWGEFTQRVKSDRTPNAMLIHGVAGVGIELLAHAMGQYLLCSSPLEQMACGACKSCHLSAAGTHPDFQIITLEEKAKQLKVDQIREVSEFVGQTAQMNGYKVVVIECADTMNLNAANALLKNLEEPAGKTAFILTSDQANRLLPTIRSRCFQQVVSIPAPAESMAWFAEQALHVTDDMLIQAGGAPLCVKDWLSRDVFVDRKKIIDGLLSIALQQKSPMALAQQWVRGDVSSVLDTMQYSIETCLQGIIAHKVLNEDLQKLQAVLAGVDVKMIFRYRDTLSNKKSQFIRNANINAGLLIEELWLDWGALCDFAYRKKHGARRYS